MVAGTGKISLPKSVVITGKGKVKIFIRSGKEKSKRGSCDQLGDVGKAVNIEGPAKVNIKASVTLSMQKLDLEY